MYYYRGRMTRVVDGDTFDIELDLGFHQRGLFRFRLLGVDTPELNDRDLSKRNMAKLARDEVANKCMIYDEGQFPLEVATHKADSFGRWLATVRLPDGTDLGVHLLQEGFATVYKKKR